MIKLLLALYAASCQAGLTPLVADSQSKIDANFSDLSREIDRNSLRNGGTARQNVILSSSVYVAGGAVFNGTVRADGPVTLRSTVTIQTDIISPQVIQAWAHFVGTGTVVVLDSIGVPSVTDVGTGQYRVNFSTPMASNLYSTFVAWSRTSGAGADRFCSINDDTDRNTYSVDILCTNLTGTTADTNQVTVGVVGRR